ncbi:Scavenger receptor cysteine-rich type 1 M130 [Paramuricea clavata]|uniref:Scavenger receptor cysteine-rich type 1 M130 n=2 Tax=Paramuricea clavata TaxID=317549 RepID=A0A7D9JQK9_PARCT|nr:Scavenger receptor cysteine-rich type 1 M130 [Paramuricea clavata]
MTILASGEGVNLCTSYYTGVVITRVKIVKQIYSPSKSNNPEEESTNDQPSIVIKENDWTRVKEGAASRARAEGNDRDCFVVENPNRYSILNDEATSDQETTRSAQTESMKENHPRKKKSGERKPDDPTTDHETVIVVGDSMIKHLNKGRLRRSVAKKALKISTESYSGANCDAMKHHIRPCLAKNPDTVILHVGTNDMAQKNAKEIAKGVVEIGNIIQNQSPNTKVVISELITRTDTPEKRRKVAEVNAVLLTNCKKNKWGHITHANIQAKHINPYGIHLNRAGTPMLAKNIISFLNEQN